MAIIRKPNLFSWINFHNDSQNPGDLERLKLVIETMPDEKLMRTLQILGNKAVPGKSAGGL